MSDIILETKTFLEGTTAITRHTGTRVYPGVLPLRALVSATSTQGAIVLNIVGGRNVASLTGYTGTASELVQVDSQATTHIAREAIDEQVRLRMAPSFNGTYGTIKARGIDQMGDTVYLHEQPEDGSDDWRYRSIRTYQITHSEATSTG